MQRRRRPPGCGRRLAAALTAVLEPPSTHSTVLNFFEQHHLASPLPSRSIFLPCPQRKNDETSTPVCLVWLATAAALTSCRVSFGLPRPLCTTGHSLEVLLFSLLRGPPHPHFISRLPMRLGLHPFPLSATAPFFPAALSLHPPNTILPCRPRSLVGARVEGGGAACSPPPLVLSCTSLQLRLGCANCSFCVLPSFQSPCNGPSAWAPFSLVQARTPRPLDFCRMARAQPQSSSK